MNLPDFPCLIIRKTQKESSYRTINELLQINGLSLMDLDDVVVSLATCIWANCPECVALVRFISLQFPCEIASWIRPQIVIHNSIINQIGVLRHEWLNSYLDLPGDNLVVNSIWLKVLGFLLFTCSWEVLWEDGQDWELPCFSSQFATT